MEKIQVRFNAKDFKKLGVIILDIDFFKEVNDKYGHLIGDKVLAEFAHILCANINATVCRWGGEEFAMIYYDNEVTAKDVENLSLAIKSHNFEYNEIKPFNITASIGIYETKDYNLNNFEDWARKADKALYEAKSSGKDKVVFYKSEN